LSETALTTVAVPGMFRYWLQGGRITVGFLGGAQIDRFANLNTTVVGDYAKPKVRLPGGGGAPEIATNCREIFITMAMGRRAFVEKLPFITSLGHGSGPQSRAALGVTTKGPTKVITDLCLMQPDPETCELTVTALYPGTTREKILSECAHLRSRRRWTRRPPSAEELEGSARSTRAPLPRMGATRETERRRVRCRSGRLDRAISTPGSKCAARSGPTRMPASLPARRRSFWQRARP
jgi:glutaconate CoA-transferase subunit B